MFRSSRSTALHTNRQERIQQGTTAQADISLGVNDFGARGRRRSSDPCMCVYVYGRRTVLNLHGPIQNIKNASLLVLRSLVAAAIPSIEVRSTRSPASECLRSSQRHVMDVEWGGPRPPPTVVPSSISTQSHGRGLRHANITGTTRNSMVKDHVPPPPHPQPV